MDMIMMVSAMGLAVLILVIYYVFMGRTVLEMLRSDANSVLLAFALLALIPLPPLVIMGMVLMNIWPRHKNTAN